ncbi:hypothetical protein ANANG_G00035350 [Anguilla anguilla]|uniref:CKK domain-containing protein n=1 Tax=Anguilla anguilla TaxID=7936 RepID=A0A9D3MT14_ANGAN|nr:hypothetical protein ANANG_G00035350 [Anguilla anguilla]
MAVSRLNAALNSLQSDMQRLSQQQRLLMRRKTAPATQAWVIPVAPKKSAAAVASSAPLPRLSRESTRDLASASSSPSPSRKAHATPPNPPDVPAPPGPVRPPKSPKHHHARPLDLKFPPLARMLTTTQTVDTLPHLRRVSPASARRDPGVAAVRGPLRVLVRERLLRREARQPDGDLALLPAGRGGRRGGGARLRGRRGARELLRLHERPNGPRDPGGVGFFFKDETRPEDEMAQRRAALPASSSEEPRVRWVGDGRGAPRRLGDGAGTPGTPQRRDEFTRQEYERRQQLKLMEELDKVLRQKPSAARTVRKQRPKTVFHDDSALSRSPAKGFMGSKLSKVYSHSSLNLSSMANDTSSNKQSPSRSQSPSRLMSPSRLANQNGEKDWENASTASSPASIPEYTGPKLFKEPSFKSNKFIIHNALSRCCLAGKVNEQQRSKIVEEMEKCTANHFLILFRDSSCQFRAVYTMNPETGEMMRLTGIGPRVISAALVESIYKYSSDRKQFTAIPSKTMSMSVDAFTIPGHLWQSKRPGTPKKPSTPK